MKERKVDSSKYNYKKCSQEIFYLKYSKIICCVIDDIHKINETSYKIQFKNNHVGL